MTAFNLTASLEASPTANFIIGSLYKSISSQLKKEVTRGVQKSLKGSSAKLQLKSPLEIRITFTNYLRGIVIQAADFAKSIRDNKEIEDDDKNKIIHILKLSPIAKPPTAPVGKSRTAKAKDIELLFYMNLILNSDYLRTTTATASRGGASMHTKEHGSITTAPSSDSYPQTKNTVEFSGGYSFLGVHMGGSATRTVEGPAYRSIGKALDSRLEALYKEKTGKKFYQKDDSDVSFVNGIMGQAEMLRAEKIIKKLANENEIKLFNQNQCVVR
jgi:predicted GIY-YIG superfamily endonuclease